MAKKVQDVRLVSKGMHKLPCELTVEERLQRGKALAGVLSSIALEESRQEMVRKDMKSQIASLESQRDQVASVVSSGSEIRDVEVEDRANFSTFTFERVRLDTNEVIFSRPLTPEERQEKLPLP